MSSVVNKGDRVKNESDLEINCKKRNAAVSIVQQAAATVHKNKASTSVSHFKYFRREKIPKYRVNIETMKGRFVWRTVSSYHIPCLIRIINNKRWEFTSVRIAENNVLRFYMDLLHTDIYTCISVKSHVMVKLEAKLLDEINRTCNLAYGKNAFDVTKDYLMLMDDVKEFFKFLEVCYHKLMCNNSPIIRKCGFIRINAEFIVPFCLKDDKKYIPLFYFEGKIKNLRQQAIELEHWDLAYIKFCCLVQGLKNEFFVSDSWSVITLKDIKAYYPPDTIFEEYWPSKVTNKTHLLTTQKSTTSYVSTSSCWIRSPCSVINCIPTSVNNEHTLQTPIPEVPPPIMLMTNSSYQDE